jgi:hypothetical protein
MTWRTTELKSMKQTNITSEDSPTSIAQRQVATLIATHNLTVPPKLRNNLRPLNFIAYHKTLTDEFGNFKALVTDGTIVWCKLATNKIEILHLANIRRIRSRNLLSSKQKPHKPSKTQLRVLEWFKQFDEEE